MHTQSLDWKQLITIVIIMMPGCGAHLISGLGAAGIRRYKELVTYHVSHSLQCRACGAHVMLGSASAGIRKLPGAAAETGVSSIMVSNPTPARTMFFAACPVSRIGRERHSRERGKSRGERM